MKRVVSFFVIYCIIVASVKAEPSIDIYKRCYFDVASHLDKSVNGFDMALTELSSKYHRNMAQNLSDERLEEIASGEITRAIVKCGVWRSCSSLLMSLHFFHSIDEANIFHYIC